MRSRLRIAGKEDSINTWDDHRDYVAYCVEKLYNHEEIYTCTTLIFIQDKWRLLLSSLKYRWKVISTGWKSTTYTNALYSSSDKKFSDCLLT